MKTIAIMIHKLSNNNTPSVNIKQLFRYISIYI